jgi:hypothetical protein
MFAGTDMLERREVLGRIGKIYLAIEGGPGTKHEASVAVSNGAIVVPVGRSGGFSGELYSKMTRPGWLTMDDWESLGSNNSSPDQMGFSVKRIVSKFYENVD